MIRKFLRWLDGPEPGMPLQDYQNLLRAAEHLEAANVRLASLLRSHIGYLDQLSRETGTDHRLAFSVFYLQNGHDYGEETIRKNGLNGLPQDS